MRRPCQQVRCSRRRPACPSHSATAPLRGTSISGSLSRSRIRRCGRSSSNRPCRKPRGSFAPAPGGLPARGRCRGRGVTSSWSPPFGSAPALGSLLAPDCLLCSCDHARNRGEHKGKSDERRRFRPPPCPAQGTCGALRSSEMPATAGRHRSC